MRTTIELDETLLEAVRQEARRRNSSVSTLLRCLVEEGLYATSIRQPLPQLHSGRFKVIPPARADANVSTAQVLRLVGATGFL